MPITGINLIVVILLLFILAYFFYPQIENAFIYYPDSSFDTVPSEWRLRYEDVHFDTADNKKLHGWFFPVQGEPPVILFCHGNAGNISHRLENIKFLLDQGLQVFIFDYRGYGRSPGKPSENGLYQDGLAAYDVLAERMHISPERIVPFGRSLGASVAIQIALERDVRALIIESAFTSTKEMARSILLFKALAFLLPRHYNNLKKIPRISVPKLFIHGEEDNIIPFFMGQSLYQASTPPKYFLPIKGAGHNDTYLMGGRKYFEILARFAKESKI